MSKILPIDNSQEQGPVHFNTEVEKSRAIQEVQAKLIIAKRFPRDTNAAYIRIMKACERYSLAEKATFSYERGESLINDASIRLAEVMAQNWGNIDFGVREIERKQGTSIAESYCWDLETNVQQTKQFEVPHEVGLKGGRKKILTDPRDIYENIANMGARRLRACILGIIPTDIKEAALDKCQITLEKGPQNKTLEQRVKEMLEGFERHGVKQDMIEKRLKHKINLTTPKELVELHSIWNAIKDGQADRSDFFDLPTTAEQERENDLSDQIKAAKAAKSAAAPKKPPTSEDPEDFDNFKGGSLK